MSYEGSKEVLCANGHYWVVDCWDDDPETCDRCGAPITHTHAIDETNGPCSDDPSTLPAPKECIGQDDDWRTDHYGNRYAIAIPKYRPAAEWQAKTPQLADHQ